VIYLYCRASYKGINMKQDDTKSRFQPQGKTKVVNGSILMPHDAGLRFVLSVANMDGNPDGNPLLPIFDKKWAKVKQEARGWWATKTGAYKLGAINTTAVQSDVWVIHMLCQNKDLTVDTKALEDCLKKVCTSAKFERASVHVSSVLVKAMPEITEMLKTQLLENGVSVVFYEEPV
jgi:hypothetical protein